MSLPIRSDIDCPLWYLTLQVTPQPTPEYDQWFWSQSESSLLSQGYLLTDILKPLKYVNKTYGDIATMPILISRSSGNYDSADATGPGTTLSSKAFYPEFSLLKLLYAETQIPLTSSF